ncbi:hypothetical protein TNCV_3397061 [Trichonephila clavipes]|nr:hypothetical protein TNCV_3397061 [Trichonephila clavipes]
MFNQSDSFFDYGHDPESNYQRYRSNSPYPRRIPQRRQSRSPSGRSPVRTIPELWSLSYHSIAPHVGRDTMTNSRVWNRWVQGGHTEHRAGYQHPLSP